ncbi:MAG: hypothetical protein GWO16_11395 [Gammaproteobacteria bacterium]|nr:hypothetical protein [Gammaproteobacteria bacterium]NIR31083.1 hypothetical protein [Gammaproteobacteria bacterium]NIR98538.1 hypothetical protein [Gammaproteobacteria bacterium]NIT64260.1 hypothetical protein [Gammaproteobacteria bacterium]NIV21865.1 hypothetical protein [Gammaproteobacteria bacterium]
MLQSAVLWVLLVVGAPALPAQEPPDPNPATLFQEIQELELEAAGLGVEGYRLEQALLSPGTDRLVVYFSLPYGATIILSRLRIDLDGRTLLDHVFTGVELDRLLGDGVQRLMVSRLPLGPHHMDVEIQAWNQTVHLEHDFIKRAEAKFVEIALVGDQQRAFEVRDW